MVVVRASSMELFLEVFGGKKIFLERIIKVVVRKKMYSALPIHSLAIEASGGDYQGPLDGTNLPGDACLVLTTDPKPRLRWTTELHERFVDAVTQLGGPDNLALLSASMGYSVILFLQKYRLGKQANKELTENSKDASCVAESQDTGSSTSASSRMMAQDINDGYQVTEALRVQMEVQRRLHEQLEVQRRLEIRIEAQGKYLQSILEKACKTLDDQAVASAGLEAASQELSELAIKVANDCHGMLSVPLVSNIASDTEHKNVPIMPARLGTAPRTVA
ncbi:hypothetical protein DH2020_027707 [Rehmannia glutinosa]|uniref:MYB-CC type transcription factor LHEQLE-containing domain-containing protein n=1 Tax=Rehmannia glutinosa TaxID=99300 RepID=A0ABR0VXA8_REHGL